MNPVLAALVLIVSVAAAIGYHVGRIKAEAQHDQERLRRIASEYNEADVIDVVDTRK